MITLYGPRVVPIVEKVVRALALKKLAFELEEPRSVEDYRRWNPETGLLPVIDVDGERVHDSTAILLRLDELYPEPPLLSGQPHTAAAQRQLANWVDESFVWYWMRWQRVRPEGPASTPPVVTPDPADAPEPAQPSEPPRPAGVSLRSWLARRIRTRPGAESSEADRLLREIGQRIEDMDRLLADRPFFYADRISMADLAVYSMLRTLANDAIPGARSHLERHPELLEFMKRVESATGG